MTVGVVNLKAARKAKVRARAKGVADANAAKFGRTRAEKALDEARAEKVLRDLDGHRRT